MFFEKIIFQLKKDSYMSKNMQESVLGFNQLNQTYQKISQPQGITTKASVEGFGKLNPVSTSNPKK